MLKGVMGSIFKQQHMLGLTHLLYLVIQVSVHGLLGEEHMKNWALTFLVEVTLDNGLTKQQAL